MLRTILLAWAVNMAALGVAAWLLDGFEIDGFWPLAVAGAILGLINTFLRPIVTLITLPFILLTLGLLYFAINMGVLWLTQLIVSGFAIFGFWTFVWATVIVGLVNWALEGLFIRGRD